MAIRTDHAHAPPLAAIAGSNEEAPIRIGEVLDIHRRNFPARSAPASHPERLRLDDCRVVAGKDIQQFRLRGPDCWVDFNDILRAFDAYRPASHISPFDRETVFAAVRIVIRDQGEPLRAALSYEPVYPRRGKIATLRPDQPLGLAYAAAALLNSVIGQALYRAALRDLGKRPSGDSAYKDVLAMLPLARRAYPAEQLRRVATLSYQVSTLYRAEEACHRDFWQVISLLRDRLVCEISALLGLSEGAARQLTESVADLELEDVLRPSLFHSPEALYPLPPVRLLEEGQRSRYNELRQIAARGDASASVKVELERLSALLEWEEAVNAGPPAALEEVPPTESGQERSRGDERRPRRRDRKAVLRERLGESSYEYYPITEDIVGAPGVCAGRPTFKYTRIDVRHVLNLLAHGESPEEIAARYEGRLTPEAVEQARQLERERGREFFERPFAPAGGAG